ncbi:Uncharacterized protein TXXE_18935 [Thermobacillus xylanilyticus]|jgi:hypothetical protein|uniref:Uncharacterized protein n=1 Tax=Thermobacillus xylanilyticus TaxID=76633 RepID=A0ABN7S9F6_THEXY|nr:Uncharacterized protein TXXE_18935 [Thermobacillus xylanilyticus]
MRANKVLIRKDVYDRKVERWIRQWPELTVIPWDE